VLLCDAQTSGGLLVSMPESHAEEFLLKLAESRVTGVVIGKMLSKGTGLISIK